MKRQSAQEYLKERLLVNADGVCFNTIDEIASICKMFAVECCERQIIHTLGNIEFKFNEYNEIYGVDFEHSLKTKIKIL